MKKINLLLAAVFGVLVIAGCTQQPDIIGGDNGLPPEPQPAQQETIKVGVIAPLAGGAAVYGQDASHAYEYIVGQINEAGGIDGQQVELIYENGACGGKEATTAVQKLINVDGVQVIL